MLHTGWTSLLLLPFRYAATVLYNSNKLEREGGGDFYMRIETNVGKSKIFFQERRTSTSIAKTHYPEQYEVG